MTDTYGGGDGSDSRAAARQRYIGPRVRSRSTGVVSYWNGSRYVAENSRERLTSPEQTALAEAEARARQMQQTQRQLDRFEQLNTRVRTGSRSQALGQWLGIPRLLSLDSNGDAPGGDGSEYDEMRSINSMLAPQQREPGSGSSSNMDVSMFREGLPNVDRPGPANSAIIRRHRSEAQDAQDYVDFLNDYWPRTGSLNNAQTEFNRYRAARDAAVRAGEAPPNWRQFFTTGRGNGGRTETPPPRGVTADQWRVMTPEQRRLFQE